jgi:riboflavin kinase
VSDLRRRHNIHQKQTFEKHVARFREPIPEDVEQRTAYIVEAARLTPDDRVLDVGTGIGVLIPHIRHYGVHNILGCDLSEAMLAEAKELHPDIQFWHGDVIDLPEDLGPFDVVFFNGMFGNVWSQRDALQKTSGQLTRTGRIVISHPMGASFVEEMNRTNPRLVPHPLPREKQLAGLTRALPLEIERLQDDEQLYLCVLKVAD